MSETKGRPAESLPPPLVPADWDLTDFPFMPLYVERLRRSKAWLKCKRDPELGFYMLNLWMFSWHERPIASIEDDDDVLADAAMCPPERWPEVREGVLHGWVRCADGRLYHPVVAEIARSSWEGKRKQREKSQRAAAVRWNKHGPAEEAAGGAEFPPALGRSMPCGGDAPEPAAVPFPCPSNARAMPKHAKGEGQRQGEREKPGGEGPAEERYGMNRPEAPPAYGYAGAARPEFAEVAWPEGHAGSEAFAAPPAAAWPASPGENGGEAPEPAAAPVPCPSNAQAMPKHAKGEGQRQGEEKKPGGANPSCGAAAPPVDGPANTGGGIPPGPGRDSVPGVPPPEGRIPGSAGPGQGDTATPGEEGAEAGNLAASLRHLGVNVTPANPVLLAWIADGLDRAELQAAVAVARLSKPAPEAIPARYLDKVVRGRRGRPPQARASPPRTFGDIDYTAGIHADGSF